MNTKTIAITSVFAAFTVILNLSPFKIPAPFAPFLIYQIWEIPIVAVFLLYGPLMGIVIAVINTLVLLAVFQGALPTGPLYNLAAVLSMLFGIYVVHQFAGTHSNRREKKVLTLLSTVLGTISRVGMMTLINWAFLRYPPPLGFSMPEEAVIMVLPAIGLFNATLALYTIPIGYVIAKKVSSSIKIRMWEPKA
jgi:riboflavin transporter FmnP